MASHEGEIWNQRENKEKQMKMNVFMKMYL